MLETLADAVHEHEGTLKVSLNQQALVLHQPDGKNIADMHELMAIRRFLKRSGAPHSAIPSEGAHLLVVIDHREAWIY